jgi:DNA-binding transcriptional LysR family regulator
MMKHIIAGSDAIALFPLAAIEPNRPPHRLAVLPLVEPWLKASFAIIRHTRRTPPPASEVFTQLVLDTDAELTRITAKMHEKLFAGQAFAARRP